MREKKVTCDIIVEHIDTPISLKCYPDITPQINKKKLSLNVDFPVPVSLAQLIGTLHNFYI